MVGVRTVTRASLSLTLLLTLECFALVSGGNVPPMPDTPEVQAAQRIVNSMTNEEKFRVVNGIGWKGDPTPYPPPNQAGLGARDPPKPAQGITLPGYFIGNTPAIPSHGIPSINMQDAAQGWRTIDERMVGQVTSWPCSLAVTATWNSPLMETWGGALATEHKRKGANVILGPSVNVHRVARGGRNAEYMSGESPYLGARMAERYVQGVQSHGVLAVVKHFALNNQETNRNFVNSVADKRTLNEVYYPPFRAAANAGVAYVMCSYNRVNGVYSCGNEDLLDIDLKKNMNFSGAVMTDWWAVHDRNTQSRGVDLNMPGTDGYFVNETLGAETSQDRIDQMVTRILAPFIKHNISNVCVPPACDHFLYHATATDEPHKELSHSIVAESITLLKNDNGVLPLVKGEKVVVVGSQCDARNDIPELLENWALGNAYVMGGSGRVIPQDPVSVLKGLAGSEHVTIVSSPTDDVTAATQAMKGASKVIVCGSGQSSESEDRVTLAVDQDTFISGVLDAAKAAAVPSAVVLMTPGAFTAKWASKADAVLNLFLGGEATGLGMADVLTGKVSPSGKLPVTIPKDEAQTIAPCPQEQTDCFYSEKLSVGWRAFIGLEVEFPFGHGLSYTRFTYKWDQMPHACQTNGKDGVCLSVVVGNAGQRAGKEVAQLYVAYPESAGQPALLLRGFVKTNILQSGATETVTFELQRATDLGSWRETTPGEGAFTADRGQFVFHVGGSSRDTPLSAALEL